VSRSNVVSLADFRARREGWEADNVESKVFPPAKDEPGVYTLRFTDAEDTYEVRANREWLEAHVRKLARVLWGT
jgi:hypothetical protein